MTTFALIPAAGKSMRMGRPKLALPLGDRTVLGHVIAALRRANVEHILVVIGPHVPELVELARLADVDYLLLAEETPDMRATVEAGLQYLETCFSPGPDDGLLLVPGDHPTLNPGVVQLLLEERAELPDKSIVIPTHHGKRGHPALIDWKHVSGMRALPAGEGLNTYLRQRTEETLEVPVESAEVLVDLDTPEDYGLLRDHQSFADVVGGTLSLRWKDNLYQGAAILVSLAIGTLTGFLISGDGLGAILGAFAGILAGLFASGIVLMFVGWARAARRMREPFP